jgi:hypothetical protein
MSPLITFGLVLGAGIFLLYVVVAFRKKAEPTLEAGIHIFLSALGLMGAVRILGFVWCGAFSALVANHEVNRGTFAVSEEDAVSLVIAALSLAWVTVKLICKPFREMKPKVP